MKGLCVATLASLLMLGTTLAEANPRGAAHVDFMFRDADANRDGVLTQAEVRTASARHFRKDDLDNDGILSRDEVRQQQLRHGADKLTPALLAVVTNNAFAIYDVDGDGRITLENFLQSQVNMVLQADFDKDGQVTLREARQLHGVDAP